ncbi:hypothetical protein [Nocardioides pakistanensis]
MRILGVALSLLLGLAAGIAAIAVHRSSPGLVLGVGTALVALWALRLWLPAAAAGFAAGWLAALVVAVAGRGEGDYVVSSDLRGWMLIGGGFAVLVTGILLGRAPARRRDSGSVGAST